MKLISLFTQAPFIPVPEEAVDQSERKTRSSNGGCDQQHVSNFQVNIVHKSTHKSSSEFTVDGI